MNTNPEKVVPKSMEQIMVSLSAERRILTMNRKIFGEWKERCVTSYVGVCVRQRSGASFVNNNVNKCAQFSYDAVKLKIFNRVRKVNKTKVQKRRCKVKMHKK